MQTLDILERLIAFPTLSRSPNRDLISYVTGLLDGAGITWDLIESDDGTRANLFATVGPRDTGGVVLSGHTDVVPVEGQNWTHDPFKLTHHDGRYYGRGTADMKGFVAAAICAALSAAKRDLKTPLHLALSYDEEIGCIGVRSLIDYLATRTTRPALCIVGEPTGLQIATGHKGKTALRACCTGHASHSALAPEGLHAGVMSGGRALNIVPDHCEIEFEIRNIAADDPGQIIAGLRDDAARIMAPHANRFPQAGIGILQENAYPGLNQPTDTTIIALLRDITGSDRDTIKVAFGTEGGLFRQHLSLPTAICGPGHMAQGHKPDEYVSADQLAQCDAMLARLITRLERGL